jgi:hypothetical protein
MRRGASRGAHKVASTDQKSAGSARLRPIRFDVIGQSEH